MGDFEGERDALEVVEHFKSTGKGWQSRMDGLPQSYVAPLAFRA